MAVGLNSNHPIKFPSQTRVGTKQITSEAASGDNVLVTGVAGQYIRVLRFSTSSSAAVNFKFTDSGGDLSLLFYTGANQLVSGDEEAFLVTEVAGSNLILNLSAAVAVSVELHYEMLDALPG